MKFLILQSVLKKIVTKVFILFYLIGFILFVSESGFGQVNIGATLPSTITQNFDGLGITPQAWTDNSTLAGWYATTTTLNPDIGTQTVSNVYNYGTYNAADRSLGALTSSSTPTQMFGVRIKNNSSSGITSLYISFNGEQWRQNFAAQTLVFEYQIGSSVTSITTGSWTASTALNFTSPQIGTASELDGNLPANRTAISATLSVSIPAGSEIMLRWTKTGSSSHGLAVDDLSITAFAVTPTITVSKTSLDFEKVYSGFFSLPQSYTVTGSNLSTDITVTAPGGMQVTKTCGSGWASTATLTQSSGSVNATVYTRYTGGTVSANITNSTPGAVTKNVSISEAANSTNCPGSYYSSATGTGATLKTNLYNIIKGHTERSYSQLWTDFQTTDVKPDGKVWDPYSDRGGCSSPPYEFTFVTNQCGNYNSEADCYNREHSFPKSWFGVASGSEDSEPMGTDLFHMYPTDGYVNNGRGNYAFGVVSSPSTTYQNGSKVGTNSYPGSSGTAFEPIDEYKGDFARSYFYMVTRYQDVVASWETLDANGDLMLDGTSYPCFEPWALQMLIAWNNADPVDQKEMTRNDAIYSLQGNRNPYIDHPEYVALIWCTSPTLTVTPTSLSGLSYVFNNGPSTSQSFSLSGSNLTGYTSNITIAAPTNFEVSTDNSSFASSKTVQYTSATLSATTIYVRLKSGLGVNNYSGSVTLSGGGDSDGATVSVSGSVTSITPTLTVSPGSLTNFTYIFGNGPSASQSFSLSGSYLTGYPGNISVSAPTDYEVSTDNSSFSPSVNIAYSSATLASTTIYVRLKSNLGENTYSESVSLSGGGDSDGASVSVSGSVTSATSNCGSETFSNMSTGSSSYATVNWTGDGSGSWSATLARTDQTITGAAVCIKTGGVITSPSTSGGIGSLTLSAKFPFSESSGSLTIAVNGSTVGTVTYAEMNGTTPITKTISGINISGSAVVTFTATTARFCIDDISWTCYSNSPLITLSASSLTGFSYIYGNGPSGEHSFTASGTNLAANISISAPTDYEISTTSGSGFGGSVSLSPTSGTVSSTTIYVRMKAGLSSGNYNGEIITASSTNATSQTVTCNGSVFTPTISLSTSSLSGFTYVFGSGPSGELTFTASGSNLTANISISAPTDYQISTTSGSGFGSSVTLTQSGGSVGTTTIYVRLKSGLSVGSYNSEIISASSTGATSQTVTCNGSVTTVTPTISLSTSTLSGFSYLQGNGPSGELTFTASGSNLTANISISAPTDYQISTTSGSGFGSSVTLTQSGGSVGTTTIYVRLISGLSAGTYNGETISASSTGASSQTVTCNGTVSSGSATLAVAPSALSGFTYVQGSGPSLVQSYTLNGSGLSGSGNITVTSSTNYEVSTDGLSFASSVTYPFASGIITNQPKTVYVRLKSGLSAASYNGETISNAGGGATTVNVTCSGLVTTPGSSTGSILLIENFNYTAGDSIAAHGWTIHSGGATNRIYITTSSISYSDFPSSNIGNQISMTTSGQDVNKAFTSQNTGSLYYALMVNVSASQTTGDYFVHLGAQSGSTVSTFAARLWIKKDASSSNFAFGISKSSTAANVSYTGFNYITGTTYLLVVKYTFVTGATNDLATLFVNPAINSTEPSPTISTLTADNGTTDPTQLLSFCIRQGTAGSAPTLTLDGIRVATTWGQAVGMAWRGATSSDWNTTSNWSDGVVPGASNNVYIIPQTNSPHISNAVGSPALCKALVVNSGATLTIDPCKALTASGNTTVEASGNFIISSDATGTGSFLDNGTVSGNVTVKKYMPIGRWWYVGLPLSSSINASCFGNISTTSNTDAHLYYWNESAHSYTQITTGGTPLDAATYPLRGYLVKDYSNNINAVFTGPLNTGTIGSASNLSYTLGASQGFNLVCNPYPSAINWGCENTPTSGVSQNNLGSTIWYWNGSNYVTYNWMANGTGQNGGQQFIPAMQAFWVRTNGSTGGLQLTNAARLHSSQAFYKEAPENNIFRIFVKNDSLNDEAVISFFPDASNDFDPFDSEKMFSTENDYPQLYSLTADNTQVAINGQSVLDANVERVIPLGFRTNIAGTFTLQATNMNVFDPNITVYLEDAQLNHFQELNAADSYTFSSGVVNSVSRFYLHFGTLLTNISTADQSIMLIYSANGKIYVNSYEDSGYLELFDMLGKKLLHNNISKGLNCIDANIGKSVYFVKVVAGNKVTSQKVVVE